MVGKKRPGKRLREDELESFFDQSAGRDGTYLKVTLKGEKSFKGKGWPWIQAGLRQVLGQEKLEKANILRDGGLLLKTKNKLQTEKLLTVSTILGEECEIKRDDKLNISRGTIHAYDLIELSEEEVVQWLSDYGVTHAKRFTRRVGGLVEGTPTLLLTFNMPSCPTKIELDYVTYQVKRHIPNPLMCYRCGKFGHPEVRCTNAELCLTCGESKHGGDCIAKCVNCSQLGHSCLSRDCEVWLKEKDICAIKVEQEVPYGQARKIYEDSHRPPTLQGYAQAVRTPSASQQSESEIKDKLDKLETKIDELVTVLTQVVKQLKGDDVTAVEPVNLDKPSAAGELGTQAVSDGRREGSQGDDGDTPVEKPVTSKKEINRLLSRKPVKGKGRGKNGPKNSMETDDVSDGQSSSQILGRSGSLERGSSRQDSFTRKSWAEAT